MRTLKSNYTANYQIRNCSTRTKQSNLDLMVEAHPCPLCSIDVAIHGRWNCRKFIIVTSDKLFTWRCTLIKSRQMYRATAHVVKPRGRENYYAAGESLATVEYYVDWQWPIFCIDQIVPIEWKQLSLKFIYNSYSIVFSIIILNTVRWLNRFLQIPSFF